MHFIHLDTFILFKTHFKTKQTKTWNNKKIILIFQMLISVNVCIFLSMCAIFYKIFQGYIVLHKINFPSEIPRHAMSQTAVGCKCSDLWVETGLKAIHQSSAISTNYYRLQSGIHILILLYKSSSGGLLHCLTDYLCTCKSSHSWDWLYHS